MNYVETACDEFKLTTGEYVPIGKRNAKEIRDVYSKYLEKINSCGGAFNDFKGILRYNSR